MVIWVNPSSMKSQLKQCIIPLILSPILLSSPVVHAQITPDQTLPSASVVIPQGPLSRIAGGTVAGSNLFHSFEAFSIAPNHTVWFDNSTQIQNIFSRVTGSNISQIEGLLQANGQANFFLINPNGIVFGPNAKLAIGGSFMSTTANSIHFSDGAEFSATPSEQSSLLTINIPIGLQFGANPGKIEVQGPGNFLKSDPETFATLKQDRPLGLQIPAGQTLALIGGPIILKGGNLTAPGGQIELAGVTGNSYVTLMPNDIGWSFNYETVPNFQNIQLSAAASLDTSGENGGQIYVRGRNVLLTDGSVMLATTAGEKSGGSLTIQAQDSVELTGSNVFDYPSSLLTEVTESATGNGGTLTIETDTLRLLKGAVISSATFGAGDGGDLKIDAKQAVEMRGLSSIGLPSFLLSEANEGATGNAGNLTVTTRRFTIADGAFVSASTAGEGDGGQLTIQATDFVTLTGLGHEDNGSVLRTSTEGMGNAGNLTIDTGTLILSQRGILSSNTTTTGAGGSITVNARERVSLNQAQFVSSGTNQGNAGNMTVRTPNLLLQNQSKLAVSSSGTGSAGSLTITSGSVQLQNRSRLEATAVSGQGGNLIVKANSIQLGESSQLTTDAGFGDGGNITLTTDVFIALENSDIQANAKQGAGGRVSITAQGIFGSQFRLQLTPQSDITATSNLGVEFSGIVELNTPEVDPTSGLVELPKSLIDQTTQVVAGCTSSQSEFTVTGRGGLPEDPLQTLQSHSIWSDMRPVLGKNQAQESQEITADQTPTAPLIEATGWQLNNQGQVELLAQIPTQIATAWHLPIQCSQ
jgi:filamentous hemagglutinin family protein